MPEVDTDAALEALDYILGNNHDSKDEYTIAETDSESENSEDDPEQRRLFDLRKQQIDATYAMNSNRVALLCDWIYEILERLLRQIVAHRVRTCIWAIVEWYHKEE